MKFKGSFVTSTSGSLGGITASRNRGGMYLRGRLIPTDPASFSQGLVRATFGAVTARWLADLDSSQRAAWDLYAANTPVTDTLGDPILLSGHQQFVRTNTAALNAGLAQIDTAPPVFGTGELPIMSASTVQVSTYSQNINDFPANTTVLAYLGRPVNLSVAFFRGPWRFTDTATVSPVAGNNPWAAAVGQAQWVASRYLNDDGRLSGLVQTGPVAVAAD